MSWGSCVLAMECEPEYRVYRGDFRCGRTEFVCCAMELTNYDMYAGFDLSFADSGLTTGSDELMNRGKGSTENRHKKKESERKRRAKSRRKRKKFIKTSIKQIIKAMSKMISRQYRNSSTQKKRKTKQLKQFIKDLKKKYREDRKSAKNVHEIDLVKIDGILKKKINEIRDMNEKFVTNTTFRDIIVNGTVNKQGARMLVEAYPELTPYFSNRNRRTNNEDEQETEVKEDLEYDIEYGMLYF